MGEKVLLEQHRQDLYKSGLKDESIVKYGFESVSAEKTRKELGYNAPSGGWKIPYADSHFFKIRFDKKYGDAKYGSPKGMSQDLFITYLARDCHDDIFMPYYFCEGEKKAISLQQAKYPAMGVAGVWNWVSKGHILEKLTQINVAGRECYIIYDSDKYNNEHVLKAQERFAEALLSLGAKVKIVNLSPEFGKGVDDQLLKLKSDFQHYIDTAQDYLKGARRESPCKTKERLHSVEIAEKICNGNKIIYCAYSFFKYEDGVYRAIDDEEVKRLIIDAVGSDIRKGKAEEILYFIKAISFVSPNKVNNTDCINLKNGLLDLMTYTLLSHRPDVYSTIQLAVSHNPSARCDKWLKTLAEIFEGDNDKIETLQEFFGLCLTKETKYEKALLAIGEGANGKSVIFNTGEKVFGRENISAIPLDKFSDTHYIANLFGKLANISIETNAKSEVYDSIFKAVVSGDVIEADLKFKNSFRFNPFCKLIFAMNNMPRVDDKTDAFFRRLLILEFKRQFKEEEQNKNLKTELLAELDGIFMWCLQGLKRLRARGQFKIPGTMQAVIDEYRRDNNNVIVFADEQCSFDDSTYSETKDDVYRTYVKYCKDSGYKSLGKGKFGVELAKHYGLGMKDRRDGERVWIGIKLLVAPPLPKLYE